MIDPTFWLALAAKMAATAGLVILAVWTAGRAGALVGGLVATLPIAAAPAYVFVALEQDAAFIAGSALASLVANVANIVFCLVYARAAQRRGLVASYVPAMAAWIAVAVAVHEIQWSLAGAALFNALAFALALPLVRRYAGAPVPRAPRRWYDLPFRVAMVCLLVGAIVTFSAIVGPTITGLMALFPIVLTSLILILQPRIGGPAAAALIASGIYGLVSLSIALACLTLTAEALGEPLALALALAVNVGCSLAFALVRRYSAAAR